MPMREREVRELQRALNQYTNERVYHLTPIKVDGEKGPSTNKRIRFVKWALGFKGDTHSAVVTPRFLHLLRKPFDRPWVNKWEIQRGFRRRRAWKRRTKRNEKRARRTTGVSAYRGGRPVANWLHPYLDWARAHGWEGYVTSGWRDPAYSESLCYRMCGAPSCPGRCAGRSSGHVGQTKPAGCIDVTDYVRFGQLMARCPYTPRLHNALGARDPVHFSVSGR